jgi:hypothetical protein
MNPTRCHHCGVTMQQMRSDGLCASCGKLLPDDRWAGSDAAADDVRSADLMALPKPDAAGTRPGASVRHFLARRGLLLIKEQKEIGSIKCENSNKVKIYTLIISTAKCNQAEKTFGIRFEVLDGNGEVDSVAFLDFDEVAEFIDAFDFMGSLAERMASEQREYTEVTYITKDDLKIGFFQLHGQQQHFLHLSARGEASFLTFEKLKAMQRIVKVAADYLIKCGAEQ